ncbi:hypothetical protein [Spirosoma pomorum]
METNLKQLEPVTETEFREAIIPGKFVRIEYLTDLNEFIKADVLIKDFLSQDGVELIKLATGETIPLNRVVSLDRRLSPNFPGYGNYSCDC